MKNILLIGNSHVKQFCYNLKKYEFDIKTIEVVGASIKGLVNINSQLKLKELILNFQNNNLEKNYFLCFFLGQVDVEFGYYYKCVKDNTKYDINEYIDDLIEKYYIFLKNDIVLPFCVISINPTVITDIEHNFRVSFKCNNGKNGYYSELNNKYSFENFKHIYNDSYDKRFEYNKIFNDKLKKMCNKNNFKYIDLWNIITENNKVRECYYPKKSDHHLVVNDTELFDYLVEKINEWY